MKKVYLLISLLLILILTACPEMGYKKSFHFKNESDKDLFLYLRGTSREYDGNLQLDTMLSYMKAGIVFRPAPVISEVYEFNDPQQDTVCLFILDNDLVETVAWEQIRDSYFILRRYDLAMSDLKQLKWEISYPPTTEMKNIKMYPPYGE
jgi:hypothetical protein